MTRVTKSVTRLQIWLETVVMAGLCCHYETAVMSIASLCYLVLHSAINPIHLHANLWNNCRIHWKLGPNKYKTKQIEIEIHFCSSFPRPTWLWKKCLKSFCMITVLFIFHRLFASYVFYNCTKITIVIHHIKEYLKVEKLIFEIKSNKCASLKVPFGMTGHNYHAWYASSFWFDFSFHRPNYLT